MALGAADTGGKRKIASFNDIGERDRGQETVNLSAERCPQFVGDTLVAADTAIDRVAILAAGDGHHRWARQVRIRAITPLRDQRLGHRRRRRALRCLTAAGPRNDRPPA